MDPHAPAGRPGSAPPAPRWLGPTGGLALLLLLGAVLRIAHFGANHSLWHDEATIALDLMARPVGALADPSPSYGQTAPLGFLVAAKLVAAPFGHSERALRALPLLASLASLGLFAALARRTLVAAALPLALVLFALGGGLVYFAAELKPYALDVALTLGLMVLVPRGGPTSPRRALALGVAGGLALWFSHAALFALVAIAAAVVLPECRADRRAVARWSLPVLLWGASGLTDYLLYLRELSSADALVDFWSGSASEPGAPVGGAFPPLPPTSLDDLRWLATRGLAIFRWPGGLGLSGLAAFAALVGLAALGRRSTRSVVLIAGPLVAALLASTIERYPFEGRTLLFALPLLYLAIAAGEETIRRRSGAAWIGALLAALLLLQPVWDSTRRLLRPAPRAAAREAVAHIAGSLQPGDVVYVNYGSRNTFRFYSERFSLDGAHVVQSENAHAGWRWEVVAEDVSALDGAARVWVMFSGEMPSSTNGAGEEEIFLRLAERQGRRLERLEWRNASATLFDFGGGEGGAQP